MKYLHCNLYTYTCGIRINAKLVKEGSLVKEELTTGAAYIRVFIFLLAHYVPHFKHVKDKM